MLAGCPARELQKAEPIQDREEFKDVPVAARLGLDLLFVIDDSLSMAEEQASLGLNFPMFINVLESVEGGLPDVHIGVVSSDLGAGGQPVMGCSGLGDNGALLVGDPACRPLGARYLADVRDENGDRQRNYEGDLAEAFACNAALGTSGCGFEQHLESMRRALDGSVPGNQGFLRDDAFLAVVFIADEDDCSTRDNGMFEPSETTELGPLSSFRCFEFGVDCETGNDDPRAPGPRGGCFPREDSPYMYGVQEYADFLKGLKEDDDLIIVANIVGNPDPIAVAGGPDLVPSCQSSSGTAAPGVRLAALAEQFPDRNSFSSICNDDLSDALVELGWLIRQAFGNPCLEAVLRDADLDAPGLQYECSVSDVIDPGGPEQDETILAFCDRAAEEDSDPTTWPVSTNLPCWHLIEDRNQCPATPTGLTLVVERGTTPVWPGTHVQARCVTCPDGDGDGLCDEP